jgi:DNA invertase Pin-like site-specific DNA recombinase
MAGERAGLLFRVSTGGQDEENQVPDVEAHAERQAYRVIKRYRVHAKSAYKGEHDEDLAEVLADFAAGRISVLVIWRQDRLDRRTVREALTVIWKIRDLGGRIETANGEVLDENNIGTIIGAWKARDDSEKTADRVKIAHDRIKGHGAFRGRDPFGFEVVGPKYDKRLVVIEELRPIVVEIFDRARNGESLRDMCVWLDSLGCKRAKTMSKTYKPGEVTPWWPTMLMRLIRHPAYSGRYYVKRTDSETGKVVTYTHTFDGIVTRAVQREAIAALGRRERGGPSGNADHRAMLKGVITCPICADSPMYRITSKWGSSGTVDCYRCTGRGPQRRGCGNMVRTAAVDALVCEIIAEDFAVPHTQIEWIKGHDWADEIEAVKDQIAALAMLDLEDDEYDTRHAALCAERNRLKGLPAEPDEEREIETGELLSDLFADEAVPARGAWLKAYGFRVTASKAEVTVERRGERHRRKLS